MLLTCPSLCGRIQHREEFMGNPCGKAVLASWGLFEGKKRDKKSTSVLHAIVAEFSSRPDLALFFFFSSLFVYISITNYHYCDPYFVSSVLILGSYILAT